MKRQTQEKAILELFLERDERALSLAAENYGAYCFSVARAILGSDADAQEVVNDTWFRAWETTLPKDPERLRPYLAQITRRLAFDRLGSCGTAKRGGGETALVYEELSELIPGGADAASEAELKELARCVNEFLRHIPERHANVFIRRCFFMEPVNDIAKRFGMSPGTVSGILNRTRKKLKKYLIEEEFLYE